MKTKDAQRAAAFAAVVIGSVIVMASSAFACGQWQGRLIAKGNGDNYTGQSVSVGSNNGMFRCEAATEEKGARIEAYNDTEGLTPTGIVRVTVEPVSGLGTCDGKLPPGNYTVNIIHETVRPLNLNDCMNGAVTGGGSTLSGVGVPIGHISVNTLGHGTADVSVQGPADTGRSLLCVSDESGHDNNQVQVGFI